MAVAGIATLGFLHSRGWSVFAVAAGRPRGITIAAIFATLFAIVVVPADLVLRFPRDMNVPPPQAFLFYPVMAYLVEITLHACPLALVVLLFGPSRERLEPNRRLWLWLLFVSLIEPILQTRLSYSGRPFFWQEGFVAVHVFAFNIVQLYVFRRYDFVSMYLLRLVYYVYWHVIWGYLRLQWLF